MAKPRHPHNRLDKPEEPGDGAAEGGGEGPAEGGGTEEKRGGGKQGDKAEDPFPVGEPTVRRRSMRPERAGK